MRTSAVKIQNCDITIHILKFVEYVITFSWIRARARVLAQLAHFRMELNHIYFQ
jgi:hypothetical protein